MAVLEQLMHLGILWRWRGQGWIGLEVKWCNTVGSGVVFGFAILVRWKKERKGEVFDCRDEVVE